MGTATAEVTLETTIVDLISRDAVQIDPYPAIALKISALLKREDYGLGDLVKLVASDQALSARVLRVASSALYGASGPVSSVQAAVSRLGAKEISALALASQLGAQAKGTGLLASLKRRIWQESLTSALLCQKLSVLRRQSAEDSFTCGLLHDFGRMVAATAIEKVLAGKPVIQPQPEEYWEAIIDKFHVELGLVMATRWNLSQLLTDVITLHHGDSLDGCENPEILDAIMATDGVVALSNASPVVSAEDLVQVARLRSPTERNLLAATLPLSPAVVAGFESQEQPPTSIKSAVVVRRSNAELHPIAIDTFCLGNNGAYRATGIGMNVMAVEGKVALPINRLVQISLNIPPRPVSLWVNPQSCEPVASGLRIELKPVALSGDAATTWMTLQKHVVG